MSSHTGLLRLAGLLTGVYFAAVLVYVTFEHHSPSDAMWWAFMTFTTVGYGDQYPTTSEGRFAGALLVCTAVFLVIPVITAAVISRFENEGDKWTHDEQEEVKAHLRELIERARFADSRQHEKV